MNIGKRFVIQLAAFALLVFLAFPCFGQNGKLKGVLRIGGTPLEYTIIVLQNPAGEICNGALTDEFGKFEMGNLEPGCYKLTARCEDGEIVTRFDLKAGESLLLNLVREKLNKNPALLDSNISHPAYS